MTSEDKVRRCYSFHSVVAGNAWPRSLKSFFGGKKIHSENMCLYRELVHSTSKLELVHTCLFEQSVRIAMRICLLHHLRIVNLPGVVLAGAVDLCPELPGVRSAVAAGYQSIGAKAGYKLFQLPPATLHSPPQPITVRHSSLLPQIATGFFQFRPHLLQMFYWTGCAR